MGIDHLPMNYINSPNKLQYRLVSNYIIYLDLCFTFPFKFNSYWLYVEQLLHTACPKPQSLYWLWRLHTLKNLHISALHYRNQQLKLEHTIEINYVGSTYIVLPCIPDTKEISQINYL